MTRIGLLSDTHGYLDPTIKKHFAECDEIWHAGDIGSIDVLDALETWEKPLRIVFGNIDNKEVRIRTAEDLWWECEDMRVFMTHIAGYPTRYRPRIAGLIRQQQPGIVVCGHSHILKVIYDQELLHLHLNPGACGMHGLHQVRTVLRFTIDRSDISDMQVIELGKRGSGSSY